MIRNNKATQSNKWQQKRVRNDEVRTLNVNRGFIDGTQGANKKNNKSLPSKFKNR